MKTPLLTLTILLILPACFAFNPTWFLVSGFPSPTAMVSSLVSWLRDDELAGWGRPHEAMTEKGVKGIYVPYFGISKESSSMAAARREIMEGSKIVDKYGDSEVLQDECHCDGEKLEACSRRLIDIRHNVTELLRNGQVGLAREKLGRALHTLQDFYSHTNWVELNMFTISSALGHKEKFEIPKAPPETPSCRDCTYTGGSLARGKAVTAADTCRNYYVGNPFSDISKVTIFACYAGNVTTYIPFSCAENLLDPFTYPTDQYLTSGYFGTDSQIHSDGRTVAKCSHGGPYDRDAFGREGISKDTKSTFLSPRPKLHEAAVGFAEEATSYYLDDIKDEICGQTPTKECRLLRVLYGVGPVLSFVIDTTGSMSSIIAAVRNAAIKIVNDRRGTPDEPCLYVLSQINDPTVPDSSIFTDTDSFIKAITALTIVDNGNTDCPELGMTGVSKAVAATPERGLIFVWTDAGAKDNSDASKVVKDAIKKKQEIVIFQFPAGCSSTSATSRTAGYDILSLGTGGAMFTELSRSDAGKTAELAATFIQNDIHEILSKSIGDPLRLKKRDVHTTDVPVDANMDILGVSLSGIISELTVVRPDGSTVGTSEASVNRITLASGLLETIDKPAPGTWKLIVTSSGECTLSAFGRSSVAFSKFDFVTMNGGGAHDGWFAVDELPAPGTFIDAHAVLDGGFGSAEFEFRSPSGEPIGKFEMAHGTGEDDFTPPLNYFYGAVTIPNEPFNIYVSGEDLFGGRYQRVLPGILDIVVSSNSTNTTSASNTTTTQGPYTNSTGMVLPTSTANTTSWYGNLTTTSSAWTSESSICRTIMYYSSWPAGSTWSTETVTTTISVPCWSDCATLLPAISPFCSTLWAGSATAALATPSNKSWPVSAGSPSPKLGAGVAGSAYTSGISASESSKPSLWGYNTASAIVSATDAWSSAPSAASSRLPADVSAPGGLSSTSSSLVAVWTGDGHIGRPELLALGLGFLIGFMGMCV